MPDSCQKLIHSLKLRALFSLSGAILQLSLGKFTLLKQRRCPPGRDKKRLTPDGPFASYRLFAPANLASKNTINALRYYQYENNVKNSPIFLLLLKISLRYENIYEKRL
jgi:hypothetical protein